MDHWYPGTVLPPSYSRSSLFIHCYSCWMPANDLNATYSYYFRQIRYDHLDSSGLTRHYYLDSTTYSALFSHKHWILPFHLDVEYLDIKRINWMKLNNDLLCFLSMDRSNYSEYILEMSFIFLNWFST